MSSLDYIREILYLFEQHFPNNPLLVWWGMGLLGWYLSRRALDVHWALALLISFIIGPLWLALVILFWIGNKVVNFLFKGLL